MGDWGQLESPTFLLDTDADCYPDEHRLLDVKIINNTIQLEKPILMSSICLKMINNAMSETTPCTMMTPAAAFV